MPQPDQPSIDPTLDKEKIAKTVVSYWSTEDECYVVVSPLFDSIAGVGHTAEQALQVFNDLLDDAFEAYLSGRLSRHEVNCFEEGSCV